VEEGFSLDGGPMDPGDVLDLEPGIESRVPNP
jgi:hypothetical protein